MATDDEILDDNGVNSDAKFTKDTPDNSTRPGVYIDMRGIPWDIESAGAFGAPWKSTLGIAAYGMKAGARGPAATDAGMMVDAIEELAEKYRVSQKSGSWAWLALLALLLVADD